MAKLTREERKQQTLELAELVRKQLAEIKVEANVRCHFYRNSQCMVMVFPKSKEAGNLNHWEYSCLCKGLEYWLPIWIKNDKTKHHLFEAAKIYAG